jgi:predicted Zn-ribbon and HTH transcriptional regulator
MLRSVIVPPNREMKFMKVMLLVCRRCGYEEKTEVYPPEDAQRYNLRLVLPQCKRCGSIDVKLYG